MVCADIDSNMYSFPVERPAIYTAAECAAPSDSVMYTTSAIVDNPNSRLRPLNRHERRKEAALQRRRAIRRTV